MLGNVEKPSKTHDMRRIQNTKVKQNILPLAPQAKINVKESQIKIVGA